MWRVLANTGSWQDPMADPDKRVWELGAGIRQTLHYRGLSIRSTESTREFS
jgi:hypothetical protein